jgi:hypothetical protein
VVAKEGSYSLEIYVWHDVHAGSKLKIPVFSLFENDLYGDPLDDLDVVAGGIFRRKQTK